jgi:hypothetical protein
MVISDIKINAHTLMVELEDARTLQVPTTGLGFIADLPLARLKRFRIAKNGKAIEWPELDYKVTLRQLFSVR